MDIPSSPTTLLLPSGLQEQRLDPMFWQPSRIGVESAWYGHVPFAFWLMAETRPGSCVELGTHNGVSYAAFCDAVLRLGLPTRCFAVDTWQGDQHAGYYGEEVFSDLSREHELRYRSFSRLLRMTFDEALSQFSDNSIDLLHIDGEHTYEAVRHDFDTWRPKLSDRAVVLFHDTNVRENGFGVWRLWNELRDRYPGFEFLHASGLGVLAVGEAVPGSMAALCDVVDPDLTGHIRDRFARLGERWEAEARLMLMQQSFAATANKLAAKADESAAKVDEISAKAAELAAELSAARADAERGRSSVKRLEADVQQMRRDAVALRAARDVLSYSTLWHVTAPVRRIGSRVPSSLRQVVRAVCLGENPYAELRNLMRAVRRPAKRRDRGGGAAANEKSTANWRVVAISGEPGTPGETYRVQRFVEAAKALGARVTRMSVTEVRARITDIAQADIVFIWRAANDGAVSDAIAVAHQAGARVVFDVDDLMFLPEIASTDMIDGIRSQNLHVDDVARHYQRVKEVLVRADVCTCPTPELAAAIRTLDKVAFVIPNGYGEETLRSSRLAVRVRKQEASTDLIRFGYAGGTRTHQRDFRPAATALAQLLRERSDCRVVLFRNREGRELLDPEEFPELAACRDRIEWRDWVPLTELPTELARFDVNLAPLEFDNRYCEAKSELKVFEAALVDVCTVASPTGPMRRAIRHGETGFLARSPEEWYSSMVQLASDASLRRRMGHAAYIEAAWRFGPWRREELVLSLLRQLDGGEDAARMFQLALFRERSAALPTDIPGSEVVLAHDSLAESEVTIIIPLHNYATVVHEALQSVAAQTLRSLDLVIVDDASTDDSLTVALDWARQNTARFNRLLVLRNRTNAGLARTRNVGFDAAETSFVLPLDADNRLRPLCCEELLAALQESRAGFAYPRIQQFGDAAHVIGEDAFVPMRFASSNYVDAMALVAKWAWAGIGGYHPIEFGWEDYDFWCRCVEAGIWGIQVPRTLAEYRVHGNSMLRTTTELKDNKKKLVGDMERRHSWLSIRDGW